MDPITDVAIPVLTVCAMVVVGLELSAEDFVRVDDISGGRALPICCAPTSTAWQVDQAAA